MERSTIFNGKTHHKWPFSILVAMLVIPKGYMFIFPWWVPPFFRQGASLANRIPPPCGGGKQLQPPGLQGEIHIDLLL